jgi:hypothetical protein
MAQDQPFGAASAEYARRFMAAATGSSVEVGILSQDGRTPKQAQDEIAESRATGDEPTLAAIAAVHEFGAPDLSPPIPERSYLRATADERRKQWLAVFRSACQRYASGDEGGYRQRIDTLGPVMVGQIQARIRARISPPLSDYTIARRRKGDRPDAGEPLPLIDTGQLINSIKSQAVKVTS